MQSKLAAALDLAARGYRVFPLAANGKTPALDGNWRKIASSDPERIKQLWSCPVFNAELDYNIGIAIPPGTFVFDEDISNGKTGDKSRQLLEMLYEPLPDTFTVRSASGGKHRYLTSDAAIGNSASKVGQHIDIKADGGFTVGPGSIIDGVPYVVENDTPTAPAPEWLVGLAAAPRERKTPGLEPGIPSADLDTPDAVARATDYLTRTAPEHGTYSVVARVKDFGISQERCHELVMDHWPPAEAKGDEHIRFRVENAYRYGQNAPGSASPEAEFDAVEISTPPPKRKGLFFTGWHDTIIEADRPYLIDGVLEAGSMIVTYGDSNTGKTFVALDQAYHIAAGKDWNGHKVKRGAVVYVASEGGPGFAKRVEALKQRHGGDGIPFYTVPCLVDLYSDAGSTVPLIKLVREVEALAGEKVVLIVIDTLARAMGGGDENTSTDMGKFVGNCDRIRAAIGAALNVVHHTGKDASKGARGSSALRAATDTEIEIAGGVLTMTKQRDGGMAEGLRFKLVPVEVAKREDGAAVTSCTVEWLRTDEFSDEVSPQAGEMLEVLERLLAVRHDEVSEDDSLSESEKTNKLAKIVIPWKQWESACLSVLKGARGKPLNRTHIFPFRQELSDSGKVQKDKHNQWFLK